MREKIVIDYANKNLKKEEVFHSSSYAQAQSGGEFGAAGGEGASFAARRALDEQRKYIQGYRNAKIVNSFYGLQLAKAWKPKSETDNGQRLTSNRQAESEGRATEGGHTASRAYGGENGRNRQSVGNPIDRSATRARAVASGPKSAMRAPISLRGNRAR